LYNFINTNVLLTLTSKCQYIC